MAGARGLGAFTEPHRLKSVLLWLKSMRFQGRQIAGEEMHSRLRQILQDISVRAICPPAGISRFRGEISPVRRSGGAGENEGAAVRGDLPGASASGRGHAAAAAHVSGARGFADHLFSARRAARAVREIQRSQAHRHVAERLDDALRLLRHRERCLPLPGRGIFIYRSR